MTKSDVINGAKLFANLSVHGLRMCKHSVTYTFGVNPGKQIIAGTKYVLHHEMVKDKVANATKEAKGVAVACGSIVGALIGTAIAS
jgi:hypothetical protein|tara:strand:- start:63 stop:320 length:258 start_codon:yes stop_codon:yes gene_type:complete